ncbi:MAG: aldo/keto reductase [Burkholderiaceae bacterium]
MQTRALGRTGLQIPELVVGAGAVGGLFVRGNEDEQRDALAAAAAAGMNWIDTAPLYGNGASEATLGRLLPAGRDRPRLSTKVMLDLTDPAADLRSQVARSLERSLERLQADKVTLLQLHNPIVSAAQGHAITVRDVLRTGGALEALSRVRDAGLCDFIGLTALGEAPAIIEAIDSGGFDTAQVYYNLLNATAALAVPGGYRGARFDGVLDACERHDLGTLAIRIFSAGVIATDARHGREAPLTHGDTLASETAKAQEMFAAVDTGDDSRAQLALRFVLAQPRLHAAIVGFEHLTYLEEAIAAQARGPLPAETLQQIERVWQHAA